MLPAFVYSHLAADPDLGELVDLFVQEMPDRINALDAQAKSRDWNRLAETAHQIKGAAGCYGFDEITPSAARLEAVTREAQQEEQILSALDELLSLCRRVRSGKPQADETFIEYGCPRPPILDASQQRQKRRSRRFRSLGAQNLAIHKGLAKY